MDRISVDKRKMIIMVTIISPFNLSRSDIVKIMIKMKKPSEVYPWFY